VTSQRPGLLFAALFALALAALGFAIVSGSADIRAAQALAALLGDGT